MMAGSDQIAKWLGCLNPRVQAMAQGYWQILCNHAHARYILHVKVGDGWLHLGADLVSYMPNANGKLKTQFYQFALGMNSKINGAQIADEDDKFVLIRNEILGDLGQETLKRGIEIFDKTHERVYIELLREAKRIGIRLNC